MASEIQATLNFNFAKSSSSGALSIACTPTFTGTKFIHGRQAIGNTEEAIQLGEATGGGGWFVAVNRDATNNITLRVATGATGFATLLPGEFVAFRWSTGATAPFAISSAGTPELEYYLLVA